MNPKLKKSIPRDSVKQANLQEQEIVKKMRARAIKKAVVEMHLWKMDELEEKLRINPTIH
jgi:hypothetical protein